MRALKYYTDHEGTEYLEIQKLDNEQFEIEVGEHYTVNHYTHTIYLTKDSMKKLVKDLTEFIDE
jgi:hypothetical protein